MSEYKGIKGFQVQTRTEDPVPYAQALEDNPYAGTWSSGGARNDARGAISSGFGGSSYAAVLAGGNLSGSLSANSETYNGSSWTEGNNINTTRREVAGFGTSTSGMIASGDTSVNSTAQSALTETYDGSSYTEVADQNTARNGAAGIGLQTAGLLCAGASGPGSPNFRAIVESWNGSAWTEIADLSSNRIRVGATGTQTAGIVFGGTDGPSNLALTERWDGSSWTEVADLNTARGYGGSSGGPNGYTAALFFGGGSSANTENWDGSSWTEVADLATAQQDNAGFPNGTNQVALSTAGETSPAAATEEWAFSGLDPSTTPAADYSNAIIGDFYYNSSTGQFKNVFTGVGAWASGGALNTARYTMGHAGTQTDAIMAGGDQAPPPSGRLLDAVETYDGTSYTETTEINTARRSLGSSGASSTAALIFGGYAHPNYQALVESWNGTSWTEVADLNTARQTRGTGTYTAALAFGGDPGNTLTETWNGSSWTEVNELNTGRLEVGAAGPYTAAFCFGGAPGPGALSETWDGTNWTEVGDLTSAHPACKGAGTATAALAFGGAPSPGGQTEDWDGSSWTEVADLATARSNGGSGQAGTSSLTLFSGGVSGAGKQSVTEEWTKPDFTIKTVTTS